jgi:hypothetical protein
LTQEFLAAHRDDYNAHGYLGYIYFQMGDLAHAEEEYSRSYELWLSEATQKHLEAVRKQKQSEPQAEIRLTNRWSQPLAVLKSTFNFMKQFSMFATLAAASGGSAPSR